MTHHGPDSGEAITFPHIVFSTLLRRTYIRMALFPGTSKLPQFGFLGLWEFITPCLDLRLGWGLKQTCSSPWELSNDVSHFTCTHQGWVDSWLLMVESQTANLTPDPSFVHNLCCRCLNGSCEAIFDIYTSRPFQRYKKPQGKVFWPLQSNSEFSGVPEDSQVPILGVWMSSSHSFKVGLRQEPICQERVCNTQRKKNAETKRIDNGLTYLGWSCLGGGGVHLFSGDGFT
jgi:hypothetical protein